MYDLVSFCLCFFFFKQKTAYEMRISDWSSDVCSSDLGRISLRTLILIRWVAVAGQLVTVVGAHYVLGFGLPIAAALAVVGISVLLNLGAILQGRTRIDRKSVV